jgi:ABC-2 type transport system permease protein
LRVLAVKYVACLIYTFALTAFIGLSALGIGLLRQGVGGFFAFQPLQHLFVLYDFGPGLHRYLYSLPVLGFTLVSVTSLSFMLSCFNMKPAAATICTLTYFMTDSIFRSIPYFESLKPWFITSHIETWYNVYRSPVPWWKMTEDLAYLSGVDATFLLIGVVAFSVRDFKS